MTIERSRIMISETTAAKAAPNHITHRKPPNDFVKLDKRLINFGKRHRDVRRADISLIGRNPGKYVLELALLRSRLGSDRVAPWARTVN